MITALVNLVKSTADLHVRFFHRAFPDRHQNLAMIREEVREFTDELAAGDLEAANSEFADVIVTVVGQCLAEGASIGQITWFLEHTTPEALIAAIEAVTAKNDAKTWDTHAVLNGKITGKANHAQRR